jgi:hypothetical protein
MKKTYRSLAAAAVLSLAGATAGLAAELPSYERTGLPISAVQVQALGAAGVSQQPPVSTSTLTPVQLSVLTPRTKKVTTATAAPTRTENGRAVR